MRSYAKVMSNVLPATLQTASIIALPVGQVEGAKFVYRMKNAALINAYNFIGTVNFASGGSFNPPHWAAISGTGATILTLTGSQFANALWPLHPYSSHPLN